MGFVYAEIELISTDDLALHRRGFLAGGQNQTNADKSNGRQWFLHDGHH